MNIYLIVNYLFRIYNLNINNYIINDNTNYPISRIQQNVGSYFSINHGTFINISQQLLIRYFIVTLWFALWIIISLEIFQLK